MAFVKGCRLQLADGRTVPTMDTDLQHLCDLFCESIQILEAAGETPEEPQLLACWVEIHAKYLAYNALA